MYKWLIIFDSVKQTQVTADTLTQALYCLDNSYMHGERLEDVISITRLNENIDLPSPQRFAF